MSFKALAGTLLVAALSVNLSPANGTKGRTVFYGARVPVAGATGTDSFSVELEPILFPILSLESKYRVIRIRVKNQSSAPLHLSGAKDAIQAKVAGRVVTARLSISEAEPAWWNALSLGMRTALVYPDQAPIRAGEEDNVFAFFTVADVPAIPEEIRFTVASLSATPIALRQRNMAMAR
jgi:hypothetical protein